MWLRSGLRFDADAVTVTRLLSGHRAADREHKQRWPLGTVEELHFHRPLGPGPKRILSGARVSHIPGVRTRRDLQADAISGREPVRHWPEVKSHSPCSVIS